MRQQAFMERNPDVESTSLKYRNGKDDSEGCVCVCVCVCSCAGTCVST